MIVSDWQAFVRLFGQVGVGALELRLVAWRCLCIGPIVDIDGRSRIRRRNRQHIDIVQGIIERSGFVVGRWRIENRRFFLQRITQRRQAFFRDIENQIALGGMILGEALQVILDAGDGVGEGIEVLPVRHGLTGQQLFLDVAVAGIEQRGGAVQRNHRQTTTHLRQQLRHAGQMLVVPLRGDELDDRVLGLFQAGARFLDHQLVNLPDIGGGQVAFFAFATVVLADHAGQRRLDVEQRACDVHQHRITRLARTLSQGADHVELVDDDLARLGEAEHGEGVGDLLERHQQRVQIGDLGTVAAYEQVEAVLDPHQLFTEGANHRTHRVAIGAGEASTLLIDEVVIRQCLVKAVALTQHLVAR